MVISIPNHDYFVIQKLLDNETQDIFLCCEISSRDDFSSEELNEQLQKKYRIIRVKDRKIIYELLPFFVELREHTVFSDYCGCFSKDGFLNLIFACSEQPDLFSKLDNERCMLRERIDIGKNLLEKILMLNMPDFILYDALAEENVTVSKALDVSFNYQLLSLKNHGVLGISDVSERLLVLFKKLFEYELLREASIDIQAFIDELSAKSYSNYFEIYKSYEELYDKLLTGELIAAIRPNTFLFRLWDRIKGFGKYVKPILTVLVLLLIAGYLLYTIMHKPVDAAKVFNYEQIGTVEISTGNDN